MIELQNINKTYQAGPTGVAALCDISLRIEAGEFVAIMGPSGSGKSTLLHVLGFLDRPDSGSYILGGADVTSLTDDELAFLRNRVAGFVFQQFHLLPRLTAVENAELPLIYAGKHAAKHRARERIRDVGLASRATHMPNELSGGEQQRVAIARSLVNEPMIIFADEPTGNLDTKSEEEIMAVLKGLNAQGHTVIMVTHEKEVAEHARRIIRMRDGAIVSDERVGPEPAGSHGRTSPVSVKTLLQESHSAAAAALADHLRQALRAMTSQKLRSLLSMLGILIGVAAVIAMIALGQGAKASMEQRLASLGSNLLMVRPGARQLHGVVLEAGAVTRLSIQDAEALERVPLVRRVSPSVRGRAQIVAGNRNWNTMVEGTGVDYAEMRAAVPTIGRFFSDEEVRTRSKVVLLGATVVRSLFGEANPLGATIRMNRINFVVIGVLPEKGASAWRDQDDVVIVPFTTAMYRLLGKDYVDSLDVEVRDATLMEEAQDAIRGLLMKRHRLGASDSDAFQIRNMAEIQETLKSTTQTMTMLLGFIAAISLLVGGIGIMNIMLVSVTERTREIGLRKAVGARRKDIMLQFLIESMVMTASGGAAGILVGVSITLLLSFVAGWSTQIAPFSILLATAFSVVIGLVFGLLPARKAAGLNPIQALRYE
ncbi:MAG: MacB family efflux pump subunit [Nitrospirae bacterium GWC2_57_13]|nr:MAG: MacB family efflux pump subunit [Nitrospirae bacterium GWC2_57_13]